jgi:hypothetical protein
MPGVKPQKSCYLPFTVDGVETKESDNNCYVSSALSFKQNEAAITQSYRSSRPFYWWRYRT